MGLFDAFKKKSEPAPAKAAPVAAPMSEHDRLLAAAKGGDVAAMKELAEDYKFGVETEADGEQAVYWYTRAAETGDAEAMHELGTMYHLGTAGVEEDSEKKKYWYLRAAEAGWTEAMYDIAMEYRYDDEDDDVVPDAAQALHWLTRALEEGDVRAAAELGIMYEEGVGVEVDCEKAAALYAQGADADDSEAQYRLAMLCKEGRGVSADYEEAFRLFRAAAGDNHGYAMMELAMAYGQGRGTLADPALAYRWAKEQVSGEDDEEGLALLRAMDKGMASVRVADMEALVAAANGGDGKACYRLGFLYEAGIDVEHDPKASFNWYYKALENGNEGAIYRLARLYERGEGVEADLAFAVKMYGEAANRGEWDATYRLGELSLANDSEENALQMFTIAAQRDHARAQFQLAKLYLRRGSAEAVGESLEWMQKAADNGCPDAQAVLDQIVTP